MDLNALIKWFNVEVALKMVWLQTKSICAETAKIGSDKKEQDFYYNESKFVM